MTDGFQLSIKPYRYECIEDFTISKASRRHTDAVLLRVSLSGHHGYGEASLPPYLAYGQDEVVSALRSIDLSGFNSIDEYFSIMLYAAEVLKGNAPALCALDMALLDLKAKVQGLPLYSMLGTKPTAPLNSSCTVGIMEPQQVYEKVKSMNGFKIVKLKLGCDYDKEIIDAAYDAISDGSRIAVDVNEGWTDGAYALRMLRCLEERGCEYVEQPMPKHMEQELHYLKEAVSLPILADEAVQNYGDLSTFALGYSGINIKLMKCGGLCNALSIIRLARSMGLKLMLGCMMESSLGVSAAAHLASLCDWLDLDSPLFLSNDPFTGYSLEQGRILFGGGAGIGSEPALEGLFS